MRKFAFRFWSPAEKLMYKDRDGWSEDAGINEMFEAMNAYGYITMAATGIFDAKGAELFEGDILQFTGKKKVACRPFSRVVWDEEKCRFMLQILQFPQSEPKHGRQSLSQAAMGSAQNGFHIIVGNIYQNPEYLTLPIIPATPKENQAGK